MKWRKLIAELKRRNVFKATIAYLAVAWVIIQIASVIFPAFEAPDYYLKALIYLLSVGLVLWIVFSWIYDWTPSGLQKTDDIIEDAEILKWNNRRWNRVFAGIIVVSVIVLLGLSFWAGSIWQNDFKGSGSKKIAVIPLVDDAPQDSAFFSLGMTEMLIEELSKVNRLKVINPTSSKMLLAGIATGNSLVNDVIQGIDYYVEGSLNRDLNEVSASIVLKRSIEDTEHLWKKSYSRDISEVRMLWADVAKDLTSHLGIEVQGGDHGLWTELRRVNPETFELYLKGRNYLKKSSPAYWERGMTYLQEAIDKNPADPYAYAYLSEAYINLGHGPDPPPEVFPKALAAAKRAIQLDSTVALGWAALSQYHTYFGKDWNLAEYAFRRAEALNPNLADNYYHRAWYLALFGRMNEAIEAHKKAQELDPFAPLNTAWLGELYRMVGEYELGLDEVDKAANIEEDLANSYLVRGWIYLDMNRTEEGLESLRKAGEINPAWNYVGLGPALIRTGHTEEAKPIIEELENNPLNGYRALCLALMYIQLGDFDKAFKSLEYKQKAGWYPWLRIMFTTEEFRRDPRFLKLIRDMNLPDPAPLNYTPE